MVRGSTAAPSGLDQQVQDLKQQMQQMQLMQHKLSAQLAQLNSRGDRNSRSRGRRRLQYRDTLYEQQQHEEHLEETGRYSGAPQGYEYHAAAADIQQDSDQNDHQSLYRMLLYQVLVVFGFALVYWIDPEKGFRAPDGNLKNLTMQQALWFSLVTFTTVGYGGFAPRDGSYTQKIVMLQMCFVLAIPYVWLFLYMHWFGDKGL